MCSNFLGCDKLQNSLAIIACCGDLIHLPYICLPTISQSSVTYNCTHENVNSGSCYLAGEGQKLH